MIAEKLISFLLEKTFIFDIHSNQNSIQSMNQLNHLFSNLPQLTEKIPLQEILPLLRSPKDFERLCKLHNGYYNEAAKKSPITWAQCTKTQTDFYDFMSVLNDDECGLYIEQLLSVIRSGEENNNLPVFNKSYAELLTEFFLSNNKGMMQYHIIDRKNLGIVKDCIEKYFLQCAMENAATSEQKRKIQSYIFQHKIDSIKDFRFFSKIELIRQSSMINFEIFAKCATKNTKESGSREESYLETFYQLTKSSQSYEYSVRSGYGIFYNTQITSSDIISETEKNFFLEVVTPEKILEWVQKTQKWDCLINILSNFEDQGAQNKFSQIFENMQINEEQLLKIEKALLVCLEQSDPNINVLLPTMLKLLDLTKQETVLKRKQELENPSCILSEPSSSEKSSDSASVAQEELSSVPSLMSYSHSPSLASTHSRMPKGKKSFLQKHRYKLLLVGLLLTGISLGAGLALGFGVGIFTLAMSHMAPLALAKIPLIATVALEVIISSMMATTIWLSIVGAHRLEKHLKKNMDGSSDTRAFIPVSSETSQKKNTCPIKKNKNHKNHIDPSTTPKPS